MVFVLNIPSHSSHHCVNVEENNVAAAASLTTCCQLSSLYLFLRIVFALIPVPCFCYESTGCCCISIVVFCLLLYPVWLCNS